MRAVLMNMCLYYRKFRPSACYKNVHEEAFVTKCVSFLPLIACVFVSLYNPPMKLTKYCAAYWVIALLTPFFLGALPFVCLSEEETADLNAGKTVVRSVSKYKNLALQSDNAGIQKLLKEIKELNPTYIAEVIQVKPYKGNEGLPDTLRSALENIEGYAGIQYWSAQHERYYDLYSSATLIDRAVLGENAVQYHADLNMEPFGIIHTTIGIEQTDDYLLYTSTNDNTLKFHGRFNCVNKRNMKSVLALFRDGERWIIYGVGGVKAVRIAMVEKRVETSLVNRMHTFYNFIYAKL